MGKQTTQSSNKKTNEGALTGIRDVSATILGKIKNINHHQIKLNTVFNKFEIYDIEINLGIIKIKIRPKK